MSQALPISPSARGPETFTASAGQTAFTGGYPIQAAADVTVQLNTSGTLFTTLTLNTDYTVTIGTPAGGFTVTLNVARAAGDRVRHFGNAPIKNTTDFSPANTLKRAGLNEKLDRTVIVEQELRRDIGAGALANRLANPGTIYAVDANGTLVLTDPDTMFTDLIATAGKVWPPSTVIVYPVPAAGLPVDTNVRVIDAFGAVIGTNAMPALQRVQLAVDTACTELGTPGYDLQIYGGNEATGGASVLNFSGTLSIPPVQGKKISIGAVTLGWGPAIAVPGLQFDGAMMLDFELAGGQVGYAGSGTPILFKPQNFPPQDHLAGKVIVDSRFRATMWTTTDFDLSLGNGVAGNEFGPFIELNAGGRAYGWRYPAVPAGANLRHNRHVMRHLHGIASGGVAFQDGTAAHALGQVHGYNVHDLGIELSDFAGANGVKTWGSSSFWQVAVTGLGGGGDGFKFEAGAQSNVLLYQSDHVNAPIDASGATSTNTVIQGGKQITFGGKPYGTLDGVTNSGIVYPIAAANGVGQSLASTAALTNGQIVVGRTGNTPLAVTMSGDATLNSGGALTIANAAVTYGKIQNVSATSRVLGKVSPGAGTVEELTASQVLDFVTGTRGSIVFRGAASWTGLSPGTSGMPLVSNGAGADPAYGSIGTAGLADDSVTYAKLQNVSANAHVLGRVTAGAGDAEELTASQVLDFVTGTRGSIVFRGAAAWTGLSPGTAGLPLLSGGAGADPAYAALALAAIAGLGTGVATALALNVGSAGAPVLFNGALGSPSSVGTLPSFTLGGPIVSSLHTHAGGTHSGTLQFGTAALTVLSALTGALLTINAAGYSEVNIASGGFTVGAPAGGPLGTGTINATGVSVNNVAVATVAGLATAHQSSGEFYATGVNVSAANSDTEILITRPSWASKCRLHRVMAYNPTTSLTTATASVWTAAGGTGTNVVANVALSSLTNNTPGANGSLFNMTIVNTNSAFFTAGSLFFRIGTGQAGAEAVDVVIVVEYLK